MFLVNHCPSYRDLHSFPTRRSSDLATAAFTWALSQGANALQEVNGSGTSDPDMFTKNPDLVDNISVDENGNVTVTASVSAEDGQERARDIFVRKVSGTKTVKSGCNLLGGNCTKQYTLSIDLSKHTGSGIGDLHVVSRAGLAGLDPSYAAFLSNSNRCTYACATTGGNYVHINDLNLTSTQLRHELFHNIGFKHGTRPQGDFMHTESGRMRPSHIEEIHRYYGR